MTNGRLCQPPAGRRGRSLTLAVVIAAAATATACSQIRSELRPRHVAPAELTLRYERGFTIYSGVDDSPLSRGPRYRGLPEYVRCVPLAYEHARYAQKHGRARVALAWSGGILGATSLGGLAGLAYIEDDPNLGFALLGTGLALGILGVVLAGASRSAGNQAHGNAIDAVNYYNDAVGAVGLRCADAGENPGRNPGQNPSQNPSEDPIAGPLPPPSARFVPKAAGPAGPTGPTRP